MSLGMALCTLFPLEGVPRVCVRVCRAVLWAAPIRALDPVPSALLSLWFSTIFAVFSPFLYVLAPFSQSMRSIKMLILKHAYVSNFKQVKAFADAAGTPFLYGQAS